MLNSMRLRNILALISGLAAASVSAQDVYRFGGLERLDPSRREIMLVFTAADKHDGTQAILRTLKKHRIQAAFFLTGHFYERFPEDVRLLLRAGHYVGSHGYAHLLYSSWENRDAMLVTRQEFQEDMRRSYELMAQAGIDTLLARWFMPAYEHYNDTISRWAREIGLSLINYTPGSTSNADYTVPSMKNYRSSETIYGNILALEEREGLNGHIMLFHLGTHDDRTDKFYQGWLDRLIGELKRRGYRFVLFGS